MKQTIYTYKNYHYEKKENNGVIGFVHTSETPLWNSEYPLATHQDVRNAIDYEVHYKECKELEQHHEKEIIRIFGSDRPTDRTYLLDPF